MEEVIDVEKVSSDKSYGTAVALSAIFGVFGVHHFYLERYGMGVFDLSLTIIGFIFLITGSPLLGFIFLGIDFVHTIFVTFALLIGAYKDGAGYIVTYPGQKIKWINV